MLSTNAEIAPTQKSARASALYRSRFSDRRIRQDGPPCCPWTDSQSRLRPCPRPQPRSLTPRNYAGSNKAISVERDSVGKEQLLEPLVLFE